MSNNIGNLATDFSLYDTDKNLKTLSKDFNDKKKVILFFPLAFSSVCTTEFCQFRDDFHKFNQLNCQVIGISADSIFTLKKFKEELNLSFTLLSDFNKNVAQDYEVLYETFPVFEMKGVPKRAVFVLNETNHIIYKEICATPGDLPNMNKIIEALNS